ncbi:MAG: glycosyltransferase family 2 protein [Pseudomonadota bacterium]
MITVIIVNWNGGDLLRKCVGDLLRQTLPAERIWVMDNGSTDGSPEKVAGLPGVTVRMLGDNLGFAAGNNRAFSECDTEFVALLNPDAFPEPDWLEKLLAAARAHSDVAAFGSRQMVEGVEGVVDGLGDVYHLSGLVWRRGHGRSLKSSDLVACEIFSPCAGAALYRREALAVVVGFDEDFFCYVEDMDLGFRLRLAGYRSIYVPDAVVHHVGSAATGGQHSDFSVYHGHRNLVWTYVKNMPGWSFWACLPLHLLMNLATIVVFSLRGKGKLILSAKLDAVAGLPRMWRKRKNIQSHRIVSIFEIWRMLDKRIFRGRHAR